MIACAECGFWASDDWVALVDECRGCGVSPFKAATDEHGYGVDSDCLCGRNFSTVRGLREHLTKSRLQAAGGLLGREYYS